MQVEASASTATTPNPQYTDPTWLTDGGTRGRTDDPDGPVPVPRNYTSGASIAFGANVQVSFGGSLTASGTPVLVPSSLTDGFGRNSGTVPGIFRERPGFFESERDRSAAPPRPLAGAGGWGVRVVTARKAVWLFL
jgi:hypothetical protein